MRAPKFARTESSSWSVPSGLGCLLLLSLHACAAGAPRIAPGTNGDAGRGGSSGEAGQGEPYMSGGSGGNATGGATGGANGSGAGGTGGTTTGGAGGIATGGTGGVTMTGGAPGAGGSVVVTPGITCATTGGGGPAPAQQAGVWKNVTPPGLNLDSSSFDGVSTVLVDPARPSDIYLMVDARGVYRSVDYGMTWTKTNTGTNGKLVDAGRPWYAAIGSAPNRDPKTGPSVYITQGATGQNGIWKSVDCGVSWTNVWDKNIYSTDGGTNISADVGPDIASLHVVDPAESNHLIASLHSYRGTGNNNGIFETTDGGAKWFVHKSSTFNFQPHSDVLFPVSAKIWEVVPASNSTDLNIHRTDDAGKTWTVPGRAPALGLGRTFFRSGNAVYSRSDAGAYKSTDGGITWAKLANSGGNLGWVVATPTKVYASDGHYTAPFTIRHASKTDENTWVTDPSPGMSDNGYDAAVTTDGVHQIIIAAQHRAGVWRFVEP